VLALIDKEASMFGISINVNVAGSAEVAEEEGARLVQTLREAGYDVDDFEVVDLSEAAP
jgi:hypothetical protein